jgi:hypothetical protein
LIILSNNLTVGNLDVEDIAPGTSKSCLGLIDFFSCLKLVCLVRDNKMPYFQRYLNWGCQFYLHKGIGVKKKKTTTFLAYCGQAVCNLEHRYIYAI